MYLNDGAQITNTPSGIRAAYNTLTFVPGDFPMTNRRAADDSATYYRVPRNYTDPSGQTRQWKSWKQPQLVHIPGGTYAATSTPTGAYYYKNTVFADDLKRLGLSRPRPIDNSRETPSDKPAPMR